MPLSQSLACFSFSSLIWDKGNLWGLFSSISSVERVSSGRASGGAIGNGGAAGNDGGNGGGGPATMLDVQVLWTQQ